MIRILPVLALTLLGTLPVSVSAKVLAEGPVSGGYYWQKVETNSGSIRYYCRSTSSGKFQKHSLCKEVGARKPN